MRRSFFFKIKTLSLPELYLQKNSCGIFSLMFTDVENVQV